jgi:PRTRC genetic system protein B
VHDVHITKEGIPNIQAGIPVSKTALMDMLKALSPQEYVQPELLGNHILARGNDHLVWYEKPQKRHVYFKCDEFGGEVSALTDHPGLVFMISQGKWYVFAVKSRSRPTTSTRLYVAPFFNVWAGGHICTGNIETPKGAMKYSTEKWSRCFFTSFFTHPNIHETNGLTTHEGGIFELWRVLMAGQKFSNQTLVPAGETLEQAFKRVLES